MLKKKINSLLLLPACLLVFCCGSSDPTDEDDKGGGGTVTVETNYLPIADPYVLVHEGKYYAYGTGATSNEGFPCFSSTDLKYWKREGQALSAADSYGTWGFWAPEVYYIASQKKFYMFYSVEEHICVATSSTPTGPFRQEVKQPIWAEKSIDTSLFIDDDGTPYLYFVRFTDGNVIWVAQMNADLKSIKTETLTQCVKAEEAWEILQGKVAEGPSVLKKNNTYYLIYSANHYENKGYGVGYATATSPKGPWTKSKTNPILQGDTSTGLVGTGHGAPFQCPDGSWKYIFHAHWSAKEIHPRTSYLKDFAISDQGVASISGTVIKPKVLK
ncbi:glycoside hydrolase family 43 protein [Bacteroides reticulotermitis]|uniref:glycoside hydrolase family 43 protein n=1 Tax=Bacteroides reticulotermitis TaxID=1133319 RepID=UPI003A86E806